MVPSHSQIHHLSTIGRAHGSNIVSDPERATTILGKYTEPGVDGQPLPGVGTRELLGSNDAGIAGLPEGALTRGEGKTAGPGDINSLDIPNDRYEAMIDDQLATLRADSTLALSEDELVGACSQVRLRVRRGHRHVAQS